MQKIILFVVFSPIIILYYITYFFTMITKPIVLYPVGKYYQFICKIKYQ